MAPPSRAAQWHAVTASFLGWTLDAFDFFVVVFLVDILAQRFGVEKQAIVLSMTVTLAFRPLGALLFGLLADRFGRRIPLMANVVYFSTIEVLCGFAPNYTTFLVLRALYGIGMGGEWGVGASLAMESVPPRWRGILSGILQSGYSVGYLLAAVCARLVLPRWGWQAMFWVGGAPALLALYIRTKVPESQAWERHHAGSLGAILKTVADHWRGFAYLVLLMTFMMFLSHGTQDLYPDFLSTSRGIPRPVVSYLAMFYNVGAILGAIVFGHLSETLGRRGSMLAALALTLVMIPLWSFGSSLAALALASFLLQMGVQGAWGIIPAHLNEMAPDSARGLIPGLAYQMGILIAAPTANVEYWLRDHLGYSWALASFEVVTILVLAATLALGTERRGRSFG